MSEKCYTDKPTVRKLPNTKQQNVVEHVAAELR